jgi:hypothetical protein
VCPGAKLAENTLNIALMNILWAFEIKPPLGEDGVESAGMNLDFDTAFEHTSFSAPKPFAVRFVPRSDQALQMVKEQWDRGVKEGYNLGGKHVDVSGVEY